MISSLNARMDATGDMFLHLFLAMQAAAKLSSLEFNEQIKKLNEERQAAFDEITKKIKRNGETKQKT